ncbi:MAG: hypothetical protein JOZ60_13145 [Verrucomicrobia bacterium]|nr:hypothetical protein [Verrucomicrobiota bacterium]
MNRIKGLLLTAAFGLITSALPAQSANVVISAVPFTITAPGTYVLAGNLTCPATPNGAINIPSNLPGPVVVNLKGFTITGPGGSTTGVSIAGQSTNTYPITVQNGTLNSFGVGVDAVSLGPLHKHMHDITIDKIVVTPTPTSAYLYSTGFYFYEVSSSVVSNCTVNGGLYGIVDIPDEGNNSYSNDEMVLTQVPVEIYGPGYGGSEASGTTVILNSVSYKVNSEY